MLEILKIMDWIKVKDRLPDREGLYLIFDKYGTWGLRWFGGGEFDEEFDDFHMQYVPVEYWCVLPDPPK